MKKKFIKGLGQRKEFKNVTAEKKFNSKNTYYSYIYVGDKTYALYYDGNSRNEAVEYFVEQARLENAKLDTFIGVVK